MEKEQIHSIKLTFEISCVLVSNNKTVIVCGHQIAAIWSDIYSSFQKFELVEGLQVTKVSDNLILHDDIKNYYPVEVESGIFDISSLKYIWKEKVAGNGDITGTLYLRWNRVDCIESINILNGSSIWKKEFDFKENDIFYLNGLICIIKGKAWYATKSGIIYIIEISTGKQVKIINIDSNKQETYFGSPIVAMKNSLGCEIVFVHGSSQWVINTDTFKVDKCGLQIDSFKNGLPYSDCFFQDSIVLINKRLGKLILYDYINKSIIDEYRFGRDMEEEIFPMEVVLSANELFVIDNKII